MLCSHRGYVGSHRGYVAVAIVAMLRSHRGYAPQPPWLWFEASRAVPGSQSRGTLAWGAGARCKEIGVRPARRHRVRSRGGKTAGALARLRGAAGPRAGALPCVARLMDSALACSCAPTGLVADSEPSKETKKIFLQS
eukprot:gene13466-biopygen7383